MENKLLKLSDINDTIPLPNDFNDLRDLTEICKFFKNVDVNKTNNFNDKRGNIRQYIKGIIETYFIKSIKEWKTILNENDKFILENNSHDIFKIDGKYRYSRKTLFRMTDFNPTRYFYIRVQNENKFICLLNSYSTGHIIYDKFVIKDNFILFLTSNIFKIENEWFQQINKFSINLLDFSVNLEQELLTDRGRYDFTFPWDCEFLKDFHHLDFREKFQTF